MKRLKVILYYLLEFTLTIFLVSLTGLILLKNTLYNPDYVIDKFNETKYYDNLTGIIKEEMSNYIIQSGFPEKILDNIFTREMIEKNIKSIISSAYNNKRTVNVETEPVKNNLLKNINNYLKENNIQIIDQDSLNRFVNQIITVYKNEVGLNDSVNKIRTIIIKTHKLIKIGIVTLIILIIAIIIVLFKMIRKENLLSIPLFATGTILIFINILFKQNINIDNFFLWDINVSSLIRLIMNDGLNKILLIGSIYIILGIIDVIIYTLFKKEEK